MRSLDTVAEVEDVHVEIQRRIGASRRLVAAMQLSDLAHSFAVVGIRRRQPDLTDAEAIATLARRLYGKYA
jgi:hypothetical protein